MAKRLHIKTFIKLGEVNFEAIYFLTSTVKNRFFTHFSWTILYVILSILLFDFASFDLYGSDLYEPDIPLLAVANFHPIQAMFLLTFVSKTCAHINVSEN